MSICLKIEDFEFDTHFECHQKLFSTFFSKGDKLLDPIYINWLYALNNFGNAKLVIARSGVEWIGFMALIPVRVKRGQEELTAYYVVNVLVDPNHQGKHIFSQMIAAAKLFVEKECSILIGHPNKIAMPFWRRAKMDFQLPLKPSLASPFFSSRTVNFENVNHNEQLSDICELLNSKAMSFDGWVVDVSPSYISWRYLTHPINNYTIRKFYINGQLSGLLIFKKKYFFINILTDNFGHEEEFEASLKAMPFLTICCLPASIIEKFSNKLWLLPVNKEIPLFFTKYNERINSLSTRFLGLSASDF